MLSIQSAFDLVDADYDGEAVAATSTLGDIVYEDVKLSRTLTVTGIDFRVIDASCIRFGDGQDNILQGGSRADFIFGGLGADTLLGNAGNDFLEGGVGDDVLEGAPGTIP